MSEEEEKTFQEKIEDAFIEWQLSLERSQQESVQYDHFDRSLDMIFLKKTSSFSLDALKPLKETLRNLDDGYLVSTITVKSF